MIGVVALIVLGPERLPEAARTVGKGIAEFRRAVEPARTAWRDLSTGLTSAAEAPRQTGTEAGNPWDLHPILAKMTPEERTSYMAGGPMPPHVIEEIARDKALTNGHGSSDGESPSELDYPMPHSEIVYQPAPAFGAIEELSYPPPTNGIEEERS